MTIDSKRFVLDTNAVLQPGGIDQVFRLVESGAHLIVPTPVLAELARGGVLGAASVLNTVQSWVPLYPASVEVQVLDAACAQDVAEAIGRCFPKGEASFRAWKLRQARPAVTHALRKVVGPPVSDRQWMLDINKLDELLKRVEAQGADDATAWVGKTKYRLSSSIDWLIVGVAVKHRARVLTDEQGENEFTVGPVLLGVSPLHALAELGL